MVYIKKYFTRIIKLFILLSILLFISTVFYYFNIINNKTYSFLKLFSLIISVFTNSINLNNKNKIKESITFSIIIISIFIMISIIYKSFNLKNIIYYIIIFFTVFLGNNIKKNKANK